MIVNFVGNYQNGYVGEVSDETHLAREIEKLGHVVRRIPRDEWREYVIEGYPEEKYPNIPADLKADINIIAKWHHFYDGSFVKALKEKSGAPVFYWVWDFMYDQGFPEWHVKMAQEADLYLSGEGGMASEYIKLGIKPYYFQFDVCDGSLQTQHYQNPYTHDVVFTGSYLGQGHRIEWLKKINEEIPVTVYSWNYEEWKKIGITDVHPAVYGEEYNKLVSGSKITLGFSVEPNCWGYWSNRVGKVLQAGGFLLQEFAPGMETQLGSLPEYFSSPEEAIEKIKYWLEDFGKLGMRKWDNRTMSRLTSKDRIAQLMILCERYLKGDPSKWNKLL